MSLQFEYHILSGFKNYELGQLDVEGVSSKPSAGKHILVAPIFCFFSWRLQILATCFFSFTVQFQQDWTTLILDFFFEFLVHYIQNQKTSNPYKIINIKYVQSC